MHVINVGIQIMQNTHLFTKISAILVKWFTQTKKQFRKH